MRASVKHNIESTRKFSMFDRCCRTLDIQGVSPSAGQNFTPKARSAKTETLVVAVLRFLFFQPQG